MGGKESHPDGISAVFAMLHDPDLSGSPPQARCKGNAEGYRHLKSSVSSCNEWYYFPVPTTEKSGKLGKYNKQLYSEIANVIDGIR